MNRPRVVYFPSGVLVYFSSGATTIGMAARDREDALREQIADAVRHARRGAPIEDRCGEGVQQAEPPVGGFEQDRAAVRTRVRLIKGRDQGAIGKVGKENSLCYRRVVHAIASVWGRAV